MNKYSEEEISKMKRQLLSTTTTIVRATVAREANAKPRIDVFEDILKETAARMRILHDMNNIVVIIDAGWEPSKEEISLAIDKAKRDSMYLRDRYVQDNQL